MDQEAAQPKRSLWEQAKYDTLVKRIRKILKKTPTAAEWVVIEAMGDEEMRLLSGLGWEVVAYPAKGVYRDWVNRYTMRKPRATVESELTP
jgi:hypothetical protein